MANSVAVSTPVTSSAAVVNTATSTAPSPTASTFTPNAARPPRAPTPTISPRLRPRRRTRRAGAPPAGEAARTAPRGCTGTRCRRARRARPDARSRAVCASSSANTAVQSFRLLRTVQSTIRCTTSSISRGASATTSLRKRFSTASLLRSRLMLPMRIVALEPGFAAPLHLVERRCAPPAGTAPSPCASRRMYALELLAHGARTRRVLVHHGAPRSIAARLRSSTWRNTPSGERSLSRTRSSRAASPGGSARAPGTRRAGRAAGPRRRRRGRRACARSARSALMKYDASAPAPPSRAATSRVEDTRARGRAARRSSAGPRR